jgi:putative pyruvate formate lyase activating enzyme
MHSNSLGYFQSHLEACELCPRRCGVNRRGGETGACGAGDKLKVASYCVHVGEEPPISGMSGSGTIFFSHCSMACVYCQNYPISQMGHGNPVETEDLAGMMLTLERRGAHNVNLVTATHFLPHVVEAVHIARRKGLRVPIVYNVSGYERPEVIARLDGVVQVYLADMRYATEECAEKYSGVRDYCSHNRAAIKAMLESAGQLQCRNGLAVSGLIVRHLVLPSLLSETAGVLEYVATEISRDTAVSLMSQYFPANKAHLYPEINRRITGDEYREAVSLLRRFGLEHGWTQDPDATNPPVA